MKKGQMIGRKLINRIMIGVILIFLLTGCNGEKDKLKIGVTGTFTGVQSDLSVSGRRGIEIAVDEINESGGINGQQIELVVKNDENNPERAAEIVHEFADEGVSYVIGPYTSGMMLAAYEELSEHDLLYLAPTVSTDNLSSIDDYFIRFIASTKEQAQIINETALRDGHKRFIVLYDRKNIGFNEYLYKNFEDILVYNGGHVIWAYGYESLDEKTLQAMTKKLIETEEEFEAVFLIAGARDLALIAQQMGKSQMDLQIYGPLWAHTNDLIRIGGSYAEGIRVVSGVDYALTNDRFVEFKKEYRLRYGNELTFSSIYSYEALNVLAQVLEKNNKDEQIEKIKREICDHEYEGLQGTFYIDSYGDNTREYMIDEIVDNEFKRID